MTSSMLQSQEDFLSIMNPTSGFFKLLFRQQLWNTKGRRFVFLAPMLQMFLPSKWVQRECFCLLDSEAPKDGKALLWYYGHRISAFITGKEIGTFVSWLRIEFPFLATTATSGIKCTVHFIAKKLWQDQYDSCQIKVSPPGDLHQRNLNTKLSKKQFP